MRSSSLVRRPQPALLACLGVLVPTFAAQGASDDDLLRRVNDTLGVRESAVVPLSTAARPGEPFAAQFALADQTYTMILLPHSNRADGYRVITRIEGGGAVDVEPGPVRTYRGIIGEQPDAVVAASLLDDGIYARIMLPNGEQLWIEPIATRVAGTVADQHALYRTSDIVRTDGGCGSIGELAEEGGSVPLALGANDEVAELACDADFEYFQRWGGVSGVTNRIELVVNTMNIQYERDVDITHQITAVEVWTTSSDPYTRKKSRDRLSQFRSYWNANNSGISRDTAQLFTGIDLAGSTIGEAWNFGVICDVPNSYSIVQSDFAGTGNLGCATDLSAHELGHCWNAFHCNCSSFTMNSGITCANVFNPSITIPAIVAFRNSISCLNVSNNVCGDGNCDPGEDPCNCPEDCGSPPATETNCTDGIDNDCDGLIDCDDPDCAGDPACPTCGDGNCDPGEDPCNCPQDCGSPPATETNCTDGIDNDCDGLVDCLDPDCGGDAACQGNDAIVDCITYETRGGPTQNKHLDITVTIVDNGNNPVSGASVSMTLSGNGTYNFGGSTDGAGEVSFTLLGAGDGCYTSDVTAVSGGGLSFDGTEPSNGFQKGSDSFPDTDCRSGSDGCGSG